MPDSRISVITPCMNAVRHLPEAIASVQRQPRADVEHIIVDGGSTDGTLQLLAQHPHLQVIQGPDRGIYDALNKGLAAASGAIVGILNADDRYARGAFAAIEEGFRDAGTMAALGEATFFRDPGEAGGADVPGLTRDGGRADRQDSRRFSPADNVDLLELATVGSPIFNAWFFRRELFAKIGYLDSDYRIAGDREFMLRFALSGLPFVTVARAVCEYRIHAGSLTFGSQAHLWDTIVREHLRMTDFYLQKSGLSRRARHLIRAARTRDTSRMALRAARRGELGPLLFYCLAGTRRDPLWIPQFVGRAATAVASRVMGRARAPVAR